jgi:hypothetical protein
MNTTINFNRIGLLLRRFFIENKNRELIFWGILILVFTFRHGITFYCITVFVTGVFASARQFNVFAEKTSGIQFLLIPATHIEKLTTSILLNTVYFFGMSLLAYLIGNTLGYGLYNLSVIPPHFNELIFNDLFDLFHPDFSFLGLSNLAKFSPFSKVPTHLISLIILLSFIATQATFMLGSLFFKRNVVAKTLLATFALSLIFGLIQVIFKNIFGNLFVNSMSFDKTNTSTIIASLGSIYLLKYSVLIPTLWIVSYFKLTKTQV